MEVKLNELQLTCAPSSDDARCRVGCRPRSRLTKTLISPGTARPPSRIGSGFSGTPWGEKKTWPSRSSADARVLRRVGVAFRSDWIEAVLSMRVRVCSFGSSPGGGGASSSRLDALPRLLNVLLTSTFTPPYFMLPSSMPPSPLLLIR